MIYKKISEAKKVDHRISIGLFAVVFFFILSGIISYLNTRSLKDGALQITHTHEMLISLSELKSLLTDIETGQRGYIITGNEKYLEPYNAALSRIEENIINIEKLAAKNEDQKINLVPLKAHLESKLTELNQTIILRKIKGFDAARQVIITDRGKNYMDSIRNHSEKIEQIESGIRNQRTRDMERAYYIAVSSGILTGILGVLLSAYVAFIVRRSVATRKHQEWLQLGQVGVSKSMFGEQNNTQLSENILKFLMEYLDAHAGAFYIKDQENYILSAIYGVPSDKIPVSKFNLNDGLLGQCAKEGRTLLINDVPDNYLTIGSGLGHGKPRNLIISSCNVDGNINAVFELGFIHPIEDAYIELIDLISSSIGIAIKSATYRTNLQNLLEKTRLQAEELQLQSEELTASNEELEEQSRSLKESQERLEEQQAEMEQTNAQLEEQTQMLEAQRDDISKAKIAVQLKAQELEQASQYKSNFLANMSHELRTPLNSSLILAKLLADNPNGTLTDEQVKFAKTIQSSGNDLLALINDILDLSKIEAGHMDIIAEPLQIDRMINDISNTFKILSRQKGLELETKISDKAPKSIITDRRRLEQILKNLLSNAVKFTEKGTVELSVDVKDEEVSFKVIDTGIGIQENQQQAIFEAFRQADGTISRKYGGTGLGLSISRELARLLGGRISIESEYGVGSTFAVTIPTKYNPDLVKQNPTIPAYMPDYSIISDSTDDKLVNTYPRNIEDDRMKLTNSATVILVVEDDEPFAKIIYDLAHELNFECLIATTVEEALIIVKQYKPRAVILDIGLPDNSGLVFLDRLKQNPNTRHIPVHIVSATDQTQTAFALGAIGYIHKPVNREELVEAFKKLETKFTSNMRRVLVVEDDQVQQDSVCKLLGSKDVETTGVGTAAECLALLKESTFDCMVLDLSLPDATGYSLLETLSKEDAYSFPPVIVYTGHELSTEEEHMLRRYSKSIIIKGAKSPERLLDEVTLFLHQVVSELPREQQRVLEAVKNRDDVIENRNILIVEDDIRNIYALTSILEPRGANIKLARNGIEALDILEKSPEKIDLVLMDVMMPEMDGLTATREIRKNPKMARLPIIMLTAKAMRDDQEKCLQAGASDYMAKPLDVDKLLSLVRVWMPR